MATGGMSAIGPIGIEFWKDWAVGPSQELETCGNRCIYVSSPILVSRTAHTKVVRLQVLGENKLRQMLQSI